MFHLKIATKVLKLFNPAPLVIGRLKISGVCFNGIQEYEMNKRAALSTGQLPGGGGACVFFLPSLHGVHCMNAFYAPLGLYGKAGCWGDMRSGRLCVMSLDN